MKSQISILILILTLIGCNNQRRFDSESWKSSGGELIVTDYRMSMTDDLLNNNLLIGKTKTEIDSLLGFTNLSLDSDNKTYLYLVKEDYSSDIDPDEIIYIGVKFDRMDKSMKTELIRKK